MELRDEGIMDACVTIPSHRFAKGGLWGEATVRGR